MDAAEAGAGRKRAARSDTLLDHGLSRVYRGLFVRHRALSFPLSLAAYAALFYFLGDRLGVSANYFVILPVLVSALCFGSVGGIVGGLLGLPANLALFALIGHPEYSPESKPIAEASGIVVGFAFGYLADFFKKLEAEIRRRRAAELRLVLALEEKELLLRELHHRVKNNLTIIKSLVQLQRNRSSDPEFLDSTDQLIGRIFSISLVHDLLYRHDKPLSMDLEDYLRGIATNVVAGCSTEELRLRVDVDAGGALLSADSAMSLGLIVNEVLTNAIKHSERAGMKPRIELELASCGKDYLLRICDDGPGWPPGELGGDGLGIKIIRALSGQLGGSSSFSSVAPAAVGGAAGTRFELRWPREQAQK